MMYDVYSSEVGRRIYDLRIYTNIVATVCVSGRLSRQGRWTLVRQVTLVVSVR